MKALSYGLLTGIFLSLASCGEDKKDPTAAVQEPSQETESEVIASDSVPITENTSYSHEVVVPDPQIAWGMEFLPDGSMLITEKSGELIHFKNGEKTQVQGLPEIYQRGQGGLLDITLSPNYESDGWIYFSYSSEEGEEEGGHTAISRAKLQDGQLVDKELLYKATPNSTDGRHWGSRIVFDNNGDLFFTIGERGAEYENPQDITRDGGKVYRLKPDGSIPQDNPFVGEPNAREAIYSFGHRNPQGMIKHPETGEIWVHEHGPMGGDEINIVKKAANYGWPKVTYGIDYDGSTITDETTGPEYEAPIFYWDPSIAPSGLLFVTSDKYPELKGGLLVGSLKFQYLEYLELDGTKVVNREKLLQGLGRVRAVTQGPDGFIYISVEGLGIVRLTPKA